MFSVTVGLEHGCIETTIRAFWTRDMLDDFAGALAKAVTRIRASGREPVSPCDYSSATVQSQKVVAGFVEMMKNSAVRSRRVAFYTGHVLPKLQAGRANRDHAEFRFFIDKDAARAWLFEERVEA